MKYENKCSEDRDRNIDFIAYSYEARSTVTWCVMKLIMPIFCWGAGQGDFYQYPSAYFSSSKISFLLAVILFPTEMVQKTFSFNWKIPINIQTTINDY